MKEEELEQLRKVFKRLLQIYLSINGEWNIDNLINDLLYEVKIRINNK